MTTKAKSKVVSYSAISAEAAKPIAERGFVVQGRNGEMKRPRRYNLKATAIKQLRAEAGTDFPNPFRPSGIYSGITQALINLGVDKAHTFIDVKNEIERVMTVVPRGETNAWEVFANRPPKKDAANPKDLNGRIMQTANVLQRLSGAHPYGLKLAQLRACIDILKGKDDQPVYMLHTGFKQWNLVKPMNEVKGLRRRKVKAASKVKTKVKAKAKPKAKKTTVTAPVPVSVSVSVE